MTTPIDTRRMPAHTTTPTSSTPKAGSAGEGVNAVALFESRRVRGPRAWDELSEIDRQVLLEEVRQRRKYQALKTQIYSELYGIRANK
ncbi:hypothetical protein GEV27_16765 [Aeromicrobium sp. S22]|uniref:hypothetical protein n=1 Tax=Aeromicrobium sp. S22 TaxID=2662029 RepID=UPI00129EAB00|nr:hypothetical protein [Aeromicrobium sp. S22]MRK03172.1 hypothetical protein [Aeromicrobium sp. S22]